MHSALLTERLIVVAKLNRELPNRPDRATCFRWCHRGVRGKRLESILIGGRRFTSMEAVARFLNAISGSDGAARPNRPVDRASVAERELDAEDVC